MIADDPVDRVRAALVAAGHTDTIVCFPAGTRSAAEAAAAVGCDVAEIAKSIVFRSGDRPVVVITCGANRVDRKKVAALLGKPVKAAGPEFVAQATGFAAGAVSPLGLAGTPDVLVDRDLAGLATVWAAAGSAQHNFRTSGAQLVAMTGGRVADIRKDDG